MLLSLQFMSTKFFLQKGFSAVLVILIVVILLAGVGVYSMMRRPNATSPSTATNQSANTDSRESQPTGGENTTITDIVGRGQNLECDWRLPESGSENPFGTGKLYTTGSKGRSTISGGTEGISINADAIYRDEEVYSWMKVGETTLGFKFDKKEIEDIASNLTPEQKQQADQLRAKMIFSCKPWAPDESKFTLPSGVEFK